MTLFVDSDREVSQVLILEMGGIGDVILSIPTVQAIRERFREAEITVLTVPRSCPVLERIDYRDRESGCSGNWGFELKTLPLVKGMPLAGETFTLMSSLRQRKYDVLIDLSAIESRMAGLKREFLVRSVKALKSVGRGTDGRGHFFDGRTREELTSAQHEMDRKLDVANLVGARSPLSAPIFPVLDHERDEAVLVLEDKCIHPGRLLAAVHPGGMTAAKRWPADRFSKAARWLNDSMGAMVLVIGGPDTEALVDEVCDGVGNGSVIPVKSQPLGVVAALLERCSLFLTNDSGPMHLAAALGVPTAAIFGQTNHLRYLPLLPESRRQLTFADTSFCVDGWKGDEREECRETECSNPACLSVITVDEVISMMETLCSNVGILYSTHAVLVSGKTEETRPAVAGGEVAPEDAGYITQRARKRSVSLLKNMEGPILDVACGKGYLLDDLGGNGRDAGDLWGVDISMEQLDEASALLRKKSGGSHLRGPRSRGPHSHGPRLVCGDLMSLPFKSDSFAASLCVNTLLNLDGNGNLAKYLEEVSRVTKPGGKVCVEVRNLMNPLVTVRFLFGKFCRGVPLNFHRLVDVITAGRQVGLVLESRKPVGPGGRTLAYSSILVFRKAAGKC